MLFAFFLQTLIIFNLDVNRFMKNSLKLMQTHQHPMVHGRCWQPRFGQKPPRTWRKSWICGLSLVIKTLKIIWKKYYFVFQINPHKLGSTSFSICMKHAFFAARNTVAAVNMVFLQPPDPRQCCSLCESTILPLIYIIGGIPSPRNRRNPQKHAK